MTPDDSAVLAWFRAERPYRAVPATHVARTLRWFRPGAVPRRLDVERAHRALRGLLAAGLIEEHAAARCSTWQIADEAVAAAS
ncbi:MAG: hypothetical protein ABIL09_27415 [Gemmatimonadota bacterium]